MDISIINFEKFIEIYFITGIFLFFIFAFYCWGLFKLQTKIWELFNWEPFKLKERLLYHPTLLIWVIKTENFITRFLQFIRPKGKYIGSYSDERWQKLYFSLQGGAFKILPVFLFLKVALITFVVSCLIYFRPSLNDFAIVDWSMQICNFISDIFQKKIPELNSFLLLLPGLAILIAMAIAGYLASMKGQYTIAIKQANKDYLVDLIKIHRQLSREIENLVVEGSRNLSRALEIYHKNPYRSIKDSIVDYRISKLSPHIVDIEENRVIWTGENKSYYWFGEKELPIGFEEIPAINRTYDLIYKAKKDGKYEDLLSISKLNMKAIGFYDLCHKDRGSLNKIMFTKSGLIKMIEEANKNLWFYEKIQDEKPKGNIEYYHKAILDEHKKFKKRIDMNIIDGIELLIGLMKYVDEIEKTIGFRNRKLSDIIAQLSGGMK